MASLIRDAISSFGWDMPDYSRKPKDVSDQVFRVGVTRGYRPQHSEFFFPLDWDECCEEVPELANYHKKDRTLEVTKQAFVNLMSNQRQHETDESLSYLIRAQSVILSQTVPSYCEDFSYLPTVPQVASYCARMNLKANPGYPWLLRYNCKYDFICDNFPLLYSLISAFNAVEICRCRSI